MSLACRQENRITHDRVSLAGKQTERAAVRRTDTREVGHP